MKLYVVAKANKEKARESKSKEIKKEEKEYNRLRYEFSQLDKNNDGKLNLAEIQEVLAASGVQCNLIISEFVQTKIF